MANEHQYVWRGAPGDTEPVRVHMTNALDYDGGLLAHHYQSAEAAWGQILAHMEGEVNKAVEAHHGAVEEADNARRSLAYRRVRYRETCRAFDVWRATHPRAVAV